MRIGKCADSLIFSLCAHTHVCMLACEHGGFFLRGVGQRKGCAMSMVSCTGSYPSDLYFHSHD